MEQWNEEKKECKPRFIKNGNLKYWYNIENIKKYTNTQSW